MPQHTGTIIFPSTSGGPAGDLSKLSTEVRAKRMSERLFLHDLRVMHSTSFYDKSTDLISPNPISAGLARIRANARGAGGGSGPDDDDDDYDDEDMYVPPTLKVLQVEDESDDILMSSSPVYVKEGKKGGNVQFSAGVPLKKRKSGAHLRPRSMTERVAQLLQTAHKTGKVGDLSRVDRDDSDFGPDDEAPGTPGAAPPNPQADEWANMTTWEGRSAVTHEGGTYNCLSEMRECLNMRRAEASQRSAGDRFWGFNLERERESTAIVEMEKEDQAEQTRRLMEKQRKMRMKWEGLDLTAKSNYEAAKAAKEEKARKEYMATFLNAKDSNEIIYHKWPTRPTLLRKPTGREGSIDAAAADQSSGSNNHAESSFQDASGATIRAPIPPGYAIALQPANASSPIFTDPSLADSRASRVGSQQQTGSPSSSRVGTALGSREEGSAFPLNARTATLQAAFHSTRVTKVLPLVSKKNHFEQEPFERFGAFKVRPYKAAVEEVTTALKASASTGNIIATTTTAASSPAPRASMLGFSSLPLTSRRQSSASVGSPGVGVLTAAGNPGQEERSIEMGHFRGVTVAGGGQRRSVMQPVVNKSDRQLEKGRLKDAFTLILEKADSSKNGYVGIAELVQFLKGDKAVRELLMGTIVWPSIREKNWTRVLAELTDAADGWAKLNFDEFFEYTRNLYTEEVPLDAVRKEGASSTVLRGAVSLLSNNVSFKPGDKVEARARNGPFWLPGIVVGTHSDAIPEDDEQDEPQQRDAAAGTTSSSASSKTVRVNYQLTMAWNLVKEARGDVGGFGTALFSGHPTVEKAVVAQLEAAAKVRVDNERAVFTSVYDLLYGALVGGDTIGDDAQVVKKEDVLHVLGETLNRSDEAEAHLSSNADGHASFVAKYTHMQSHTEVPHLREKVLMSPVFIAIDQMVEFRDAFQAVKEGDDLQDDSVISKHAFVEVCCKLSEILRCNKIRL